MTFNEEEISRQWLGSMQAGLGEALASSMQLQHRLSAAMQIVDAQAVQIDALKARIVAQDADISALQEQLRPDFKHNRKPRT